MSYPPTLTSKCAKKVAEELLNIFTDDGEFTIHEKGLYTIGTKSGKIKGKLSLSQFEPIDYKGLEDNHVPPNIELSLRVIVRTQSVCKGQVFTKCNCKGTCLRNCSCYI